MRMKSVKISVLCVAYQKVLPTNKYVWMLTIFSLNTDVVSEKAVAYNNF